MGRKGFQIIVIFCLVFSCFIFSFPKMGRATTTKYSSNFDSRGSWSGDQYIYVDELHSRLYWKTGTERCAAYDYVSAETEVGDVIEFEFKYINHIDGNTRQKVYFGFTDELLYEEGIPNNFIGGFSTNYWDKGQSGVEIDKNGQHMYGWAYYYPSGVETNFRVKIEILSKSSFRVQVWVNEVLELDDTGSGDITGISVNRCAAWNKKFHYPIQGTYEGQTNYISWTSSVQGNETILQITSPHCGSPLQYEINNPLVISWSDVGADYYKVEYYFREPDNRQSFIWESNSISLNLSPSFWNEFASAGPLYIRVTAFGTGQKVTGPTEWCELNFALYNSDLLMYDSSVDLPDYVYCGGGTLYFRVTPVKAKLYLTERVPYQSSASCSFLLEVSSMQDIEGTYRSGLNMADVYVKKGSVQVAIPESLSVDYKNICVNGLFYLNGDEARDNRINYITMDDCGGWEIIRNTLIGLIPYGSMLTDALAVGNFLSCVDQRFQPSHTRGTLLESYNTHDIVTATWPERWEEYHEVEVLIPIYEGIGEVLSKISSSGTAFHLQLDLLCQAYCVGRYCDGESLEENLKFEMVKDGIK